MKINGMKVVDAKSKLVLNITRADVRKGANKDPGACAAAQCLLRKAGVKQARVHIGRTYLQVGDKWVRFQTPRALRQEIVAFDRGGTFEPGEYALRPLAPSDKPTGRRQGAVKAKNQPRLAIKHKKRKYHTVANVRSHGANR